MNKYKILSWVFLLLALVVLVIAIVYIADFVKCTTPSTPTIMSIIGTDVICRQYSRWVIGSIIADIFFWLGFVYFLRKSKKHEQI